MRRELGLPRLSREELAEEVERCMARLGLAHDEPIRVEQLARVLRAEPYCQLLPSPVRQRLSGADALSPSKMQVA